MLTIERVRYKTILLSENNTYKERILNLAGVRIVVAFISPGEVYTNTTRLYSYAFSYMLMESFPYYKLCFILVK